MASALYCTSGYVLCNCYEIVVTKECNTVNGRWIGCDPPYLYFDTVSVKRG